MSQMGKHCKMLAVDNKKYSKIHADHRRSHYFDVKNLKISQGQAQVKGAMSRTLAILGPEQVRFLPLMGL